jgi:hypothetical protein
MPGTTILEIVVARPRMVALGQLSRELQWRVRARGGSNENDLSGFSRSSNNLSNG